MFRKRIRLPVWLGGSNRIAAAGTVQGIADSAIDDHLEILAALEAGYADKAAALMLHHLTQSQSQNEAA